MVLTSSLYTQEMPTRIKVVRLLRQYEFENFWAIESALNEFSTTTGDPYDFCYCEVQESGRGGRWSSGADCDKSVARPRAQRDLFGKEHRDWRGLEL